MTPRHEFSREISVNRIGDSELKTTIEATPEECSLIARRLALPELSMLRCAYRLIAESNHSILAHGVLVTKFHQTCVVTLESFEDMLTVPFSLRFVPEEAFSESPEPDMGAVDTIPYQGSEIDLGEATVEQLALELPTYPHMPGVVLPSEIMSEEEVNNEPEEKVNPFAVLRELSHKKS